MTKKLQNGTRKLEVHTIEVCIVILILAIMYLSNFRNDTPDVNNWEITGLASDKSRLYLSHPDRLAATIRVEWDAIPEADGYEIECMSYNRLIAREKVELEYWHNEDDYYFKNGTNALKVRVRPYVLNKSGNEIYGKYSEWLILPVYNSELDVSEWEITCLTDKSKFNLERGKLYGEIKVKWNEIPYADGYEVECTAFENASQIETTYEPLYYRSGIFNDFVYENATNELKIRIRPYIYSFEKKVYGKYSEWITLIKIDTNDIS